VDLALYCTGFPKPLTITGVSHSVLGRDPRSYVYTSMWAGPPDYDGIYDVEEHVSGILRTDGPAISFEGAWAQGVDEQVMHVDFHGNKGGIRLNYGGDFIQYGWRDGALYQTRPTLTPRNMYQTQIDSFVHCAAEGKASPASIESVIVSQHVIDLFYSSSKVGKELSFR
jgi:predicted dehydrogenase